MKKIFTMGFVLVIAIVFSACTTDIRAMNKYRAMTPQKVAQEINKDPDFIHKKVRGKDRPIHAAAFFNKNPAVMRKIIAAGTKIDLRTNYNNTALHEAAWSEYSSASVMRVLLEAGADVNAIGFAGNTPLHLVAIYNYSPSAVKVLMQYGANPDIKNRQGKTARELVEDEASSGFQWGKFAALTTGAVLGGANKLDSATQVQLVGSIAQDSQKGVVGSNNFLSTVSSLSAQQNSGKSSTSQSATKKVEKIYNYDLKCPSGVSKTIPVNYYTEKCKNAKINFAKIYGCNRAHEFQAATARCVSDCGDPQCSEK
jgi:hypothetical protein